MSFKLRVLVSYAYITGPLVKALRKHQDKITLLLDSGAFSAWNVGKSITLDRYCEFLDSDAIKPWRYFALDVIEDPESTMKNYRAMLERGYNPIPVFTPSQDFAAIDEYYQTTDLIGCGGLVDKIGGRSLRYLQKVTSVTAGRKLHLLGLTKPDYLKHFRPYSCDSSSWVRAQRYGQCDLYTGNGIYIPYRRQQAANRPPERVLSAIKGLGLSITEFMKEENWRGGERSIAAVASARSWVKYMIDADAAIGTQIFLALGTPGHLELAVESWEYWRERLGA